MQLTASGCRFIDRGISQRHIVWGISVIWEIPVKEGPIMKSLVTLETRMVQSVAEGPGEVAGEVNQGIPLVTTLGRIVDQPVFVVSEPAHGSTVRRP